MRRLNKVAVSLIGLWSMTLHLDPAWSARVQPLTLPESPAQVLASPAPQGPPQIIWFHAVKSNPISSLRTALASRMPNHVMVSYMHRRDADWQKSREALEAIQLVQQSGMRLIWCRDLWPYYKNQGMREAVLLDPNYYMQEILALRAEAQAMNADAVALDVEPYGLSPLKAIFKANVRLNPRDLKIMEQAIDLAIQQAGQVDFVLPAGSLQRDHPYNLLSHLGMQRISEGTYYQDGGVVRPVPYTFEVFGAHVSTRKWGFAPEGRSCYLVEDLFDRSQIWSSKQGLFLYSTGQDSPKVAKALQDYAKAVTGQKQEPGSKK
jgi:hypothetical protein